MALGGADPPAHPLETAMQAPRLPWFATATLALAGRSTAQCGPDYITELLPNDPQISTHVGRSVGISGDVVVSGSGLVDYNSNGNGFRGAVYIWRKLGGSYVFEAKLPGFAYPQTYFGDAVDVDGDVLIASQFADSYPAESVRVFRRVGGTWTYEAQLMPADPLTTNGTQLRSLAVDGERVAVGHRTALGSPVVPGFAYTGAVYLYERAGGLWTQQAKLVPADATNGDQTGWAVALEGEVLAFSSRASPLGNYPPLGRVHVYSLASGVPQLEATLLASNPGQGNDYGYSVATDGTFLAVGDPWDLAVGGQYGCVYVYRKTVSGWVELDVVRPTIPSGASAFGSEVAIDGDDLYVGSSAPERLWHFRRDTSGRWAELGTSEQPAVPSWDVASLAADGGAVAAGARTVYGQSGGVYIFDGDASPGVCTYCTAKTNSAGCVPAIGWSGAPSVAGGNFQISAQQILANKAGLLFYGAPRTPLSFEGGTMCAATPLARTPLANSGGTAGCDGSFSYDFAARIASAVDPRLVVGSRWVAQFWSRDPSASYTTNLTNSLLFTIQP